MNKKLLSAFYCCLFFMSISTSVLALDEELDACFATKNCSSVVAGSFAFVSSITQDYAIGYYHQKRYEKKQKEFNNHRFLSLYLYRRQILNDNDLLLSLAFIHSSDHAAKSKWEAKKFRLDHILGSLGYASFVGAIIYFVIPEVDSSESSNLSYRTLVLPDRLALSLEFRY